MYKYIYKRDSNGCYVRAKWLYFLSYPIYTLVRPRAFRNDTLHNWYHSMVFVETMRIK